MAKLRLTVACGDYDTVKALKEGTVEAAGLELFFLTDMGPRERHWRLARKNEFDVCEENVGAYFMSRDRRRFRSPPSRSSCIRRFHHGFVFVNTAIPGIKSPKDLVGKPVGGTNYQPAGNIWMRGILEVHYGVPHRQSTWIVDRSEDVPFKAPPDLKIEMKSSPKSLSDMLADGDIPAMISPTNFSQPFLRRATSASRGCFRTTSRSRWTISRQTGIFPIMHVTTIRQDIVDKYPWVTTNLVKAFEQAKLAAYRRVANPRMVPLAWVRTAVEEQQDILGRDPWEFGLTPSNRKNLETIQRYTHQQGMTSKIRPLEELFERTPTRWTIPSAPRCDGCDGRQRLPVVIVQRKRDNPVNANASDVLRRLRLLDAPLKGVYARLHELCARMTRRLVVAESDPP